MAKFGTLVIIFGVLDFNAIDLISRAQTADGRSFGDCELTTQPCIIVIYLGGRSALIVRLPGNPTTRCGGNIGYQLSGTTVKSFDRSNLSQGR